MPIDLDPKSLAETARSISKALMSMKSSALVLIHSKQIEDYDAELDMIKIRLTPQVKIENRYKLEVPQ